MQKIHKSQVVGLPPHAHLQYLGGVPRIYFQYSYTIDGKKYTERDYLGSVDTLTQEFIPNAYYMREKPVFENRPIHRYKNEEKRIREIERRNKELLARKPDILKNEELKAKAAIEQESKAGEFKADETIARQTLPKFSVVALDHLVLTVGSIEETKNFYAKVLGFKVETFNNGRTALKAGHMKINLHEAGKEFAPHAKVPTPGSADLCLLTETPIEEVVESLTQMEIPLVEGPIYRTGASGKLLSVYIRDPDGNLLEVANQMPASS